MCALLNRIRIVKGKQGEKKEKDKSTKTAQGSVGGSPLMA